MTIEFSESIEKYGVVHDTFGGELRKKIAEYAAECVDSSLLLYGDPKDYRTFRNLGDSVAEAVVLYLVTEGFLSVPEEYQSTDEERDASKAKRDQRSQGPSNPFGSPAVAAGAGQYL